jgi:hypothetical protein
MSVKTSVVVVVHYSGLNVAQMQPAQADAGAAGANVQAAKEPPRPDCSEGTGRPIGPLLKGLTLIAHSSDPVAGPRQLWMRQGSREVPCSWRFHGQDGPRCRWGQGARDLAVLDELRAIGALRSPATKLAQLDRPRSQACKW